MSKRYDVYLASSQQKISQDWQPQPNPVPLSLLRDDTTAFQIATRLNSDWYQWANIKIETDIPAEVAVRQVKLVPAVWPVPGMFPDRLSKLEATKAGYLGKIKLVPHQFRALWIDIEASDQAPGGIYQIAVIAEDDHGEEIFKIETEIQIIPMVLPEGDVYHTEWFHADCLADYYKIPVFSDTHWDIVENFVKCASKRGMNTLLTPIFTYPLDTVEGGARTTIQLVKMKLENGHYQFDFTLLDRWVRMCQRVGIKNFEMAHLYSQWGAKYAPKIIVEVDGQEQELFGWHTMGTSPEYQAFLRAFLPALDEQLQKLGIAEQTFFHISDEPSMQHLEQYTKARLVVEELLPNYKIIDALTDFEFYQKGICTHPIPANNHIQPFLEAKVPELWTYYCVAQKGPESNRFFHLESSRARIIGAQIYKYELTGFLHWGFNFYNSQYSVKKINPYEITDADEAFDAGDAFLVYPGADGHPEESYRILMMDAAFKDIRALKLLERLTDRKTVMEMVDNILNQPTMLSYPHSEEPLLKLRDAVNHRILELTS